MVTAARRFSSCARGRPVCGGCLGHRGFPEGDRVAWPGLGQDVQGHAGDHGEDRISGGDAAAAVQDQQLVPGRHLDGAHRNARVRALRR